MSDYYHDASHPEIAREHFVESGKSRSLNETQRFMKQKFPVNHPHILTIEQWARQGGWQASADKFDRRQDRREKLEREFNEANGIEQPTIDTQLQKCREAMRIAYDAKDMRAYFQFLKLECELAGLLIKKEAVIVKNIANMSKEELLDAHAETKQLLKQFEDSDEDGNGSPSQGGTLPTGDKA